MKEIPLSQGKFALVDDEDYEWLSSWHWYTFKGNTTLYAARKERDGSTYKTVFMHRVVLNAPKAMEVDHINSNGLDNRRENLRNCTRSQNLMNTRIRSDNTSGYKGVTFDKQTGRFSAKIQINKKCINIGRFDTAEEAAREYDKFAVKYFKAYARTNFDEQI